MLFAIGLAAAPAAGAATAAAVDQYQPQPPGGGSNAVGGQGPGSTGQNSSALPSGLAAGSEAQQGDGSSLPFTGYPLTNLVLIIGLLVGAGIAVRFGVAGYQRLRTNAE